MISPRLHLTPREAAALLARGFVGVDEDQMRRAGEDRPRVADLIRSRRLVYSPVDPGEEWQSYRDFLASIRTRGYALADCEDLATALAAEARVDGIDPKAYPGVYRVRPGLSHVVTVLPSLGRRIDPSRLAGMGTKSHRFYGHYRPWAVA